MNAPQMVDRRPAHVRAGVPLGTWKYRQRALAPIDRFLSHVVVGGPSARNAEHLGPCAYWTGGATPDGYPVFSDENGRSVRATRWIYEQFAGPIPLGRVLDHFACDNGPQGCVMPTHVRPVTPRENALRSNNAAALAAARTHCSSGHPLDETNTYWWRGMRHCRPCRKARQAARRQRAR